MSESNDLVFHNQRLSPMNNGSRRELPSSIPIMDFSNCKFNDDDDDDDVYVNRDEDYVDDDVHDDDSDDDDSDDDDSDDDVDDDVDEDIDSDDVVMIIMLMLK